MIRRIAAVVLVAFFMPHAGQAQQIQKLPAEPLSRAVGQVRVQPATSGRLVPLITWGADIATIYTASSNIFQQENLNVELFVENDVVKQVQGVLQGRTPYFRGTMGMVVAAAEAMKVHGVELTGVDQLSWSTGDDALVVRSHIKTPKDLCGKTIAVQRYGPHMDFIANILTNAGCNLAQINFVWLQELSFPLSYDPGNQIVDPASAFAADPKIDAATVIIPDALNLTSGGKVGKGGDGSVQGAYVLFTSKSASKIIADVYAVRTDYYNAHKDEVQRFTHALMRGQEAFDNLLENKATKQSEYRQLITRSAELLFGSAQATGDAEAFLEGGHERVGYSGNVAFFTATAPTARSFTTLTKEIQTAFRTLGYVSATAVPLHAASWDYAALAAGLTKATNVPAPRPAFDTRRAEAVVTRKVIAEPSTWEEGTMFVVEIYFEPEQTDFPAAQYAADFQDALKKSQTYGGALVVVEGHADPSGILIARQKRENPAIINEMEQHVKNISYERARTVIQSFVAYAKANGVTLDSSRFLPLGMGIASPKYNPPRTKEEWNANRRVVFRVKQIEAELKEFVPLGP